MTVDEAKRALMLVLYREYPPNTVDAIEALVRAVLAEETVQELPVDPRLTVRAFGSSER